MGWGGTADREAVASPGMTLAAGNALCDVKVNYFWEKCQLGPNGLEMCRQSCSLAHGVGGGTRGAPGGAGGRAGQGKVPVFRPGTYVGTWGFETPAPGLGGLGEGDK